MALGVEQVMHPAPAGSTGGADVGARGRRRFGGQHLEAQPGQVGAQPLHGKKGGGVGHQQRGHAGHGQPHQHLVAGDHAQGGGQTAHATFAGGGDQRQVARAGNGEERGRSRRQMRRSQRCRTWGAFLNGERVSLRESSDSSVVRVPSVARAGERGAWAAPQGVPDRCRPQAPHSPEGFALAACRCAASARGGDAGQRLGYSL